MAATPKPKPRRNRALLWLLAGAVIFAVAIYSAIGYVYVYDRTLPDDADLLVTSPTVPDQQNGLHAIEKFDKSTLAQLDFVLFANAHDVDDETARKILLGEQANEALISAFLAQAQPALAQVEAAVTQPYFEFSSQVHVDTLAPVAPLLNSGKSLLLTARQAKNLGDYETAVRQILLAKQLSDRLAGSHGMILHALTAVTINHLVQREAIRWLNDPQASSAMIASLAHVFGQETDWTPCYQQAFRLEYQYSLACLNTAMIHPEVVAKLSDSQDNWAWRLIVSNIKLNETRYITAEYFRAGVTGAELTYAALLREKSEALTEADRKISPWEILLPNGGGRYFLSINLPQLASILGTAYQATATDRLMQAGFALRHYYDDHHALPAKLAELVPQYIPEVPMDPFDGQPLRYDAARGLVYSVGVSLKDNGGSKYLVKSVPNPDDVDPFTDKEQPTLALELQKPAPAAPAQPAN